MLDFISPVLREIFEAEMREFSVTDKLTDRRTHKGGYSPVIAIHLRYSYRKIRGVMEQSAAKVFANTPIRLSIVRVMNLSSFQVPARS